MTGNSMNQSSSSENMDGRHNRGSQDQNRQANSSSAENNARVSKSDGRRANANDDDEGDKARNH